MTMVVQSALWVISSLTDPSLARLQAQMSRSRQCNRATEL
jgi:hypothetical protein